MGTFSVRRAAGAGFRLIRREPKAVLIWAGIYLALFAVFALLFASMIAQISKLDFEEGGAEPQLADIFGLQLQMLGAQSLFMVGVYALRIFMTSAIFRAVLEPEARRWGYLRVSSQELWLGLVILVMSFGFGMAAMAVLLPLIGIGAGLGIALHGLVGTAGSVLVALPFLAIGIGLVVWAALRLCLAYPMSFSERTFRLFEAWPLSKGLAGKLLLMFILAGLAAFAIELLITAVSLGAVFAMVSPHWETIAATAPLDLLRKTAIIMPFTAILGSVALACMTAIVTPPLADAYRQLNEAPA
ncbi:MAG TPA: hypothetical protein VIO94_00200 [Phenylobacterium sp.]